MNTSTSNGVVGNRRNGGRPVVDKEVDFANYFCTYAFLYHQKEMLSDRVRMDAYYNSIFRNKSHFLDKVVLDVGTGSGILAIWSAQAGAKKVYAVEATKMADHARELVRANNLEGIVEVIEGSIEDVILPEKVDVIISEWMGYFLLRESMFDSVICARDRWLKPTGVMYMLTEEGKKAACECLSRSGLATSSDPVERSLDFDESIPTDQEFPTDSVQESRLHHVSIVHKKSAEVPPESLNRFLSMGYSKEQILLAFADVQKSSPNKNMSSLWPAVLCRLRAAEVYGSSSDFQNKLRCDPQSHPLATNSYARDGEIDTHISKNRTGSGGEGEVCISKSKFQQKSKFHTVSSQIDLSMKACSTTDNHVLKQRRDGWQIESNVLTVPPLSFGETFKDAYDVILILDDREKFTMQGSKCRKIVENISKEFNIEIEIRRLPVGDAIWVARHKQFLSEYVLDLIVERKRVDDLRSSIRDNRYRDQKVRLLRCGLKKLIYVVEGDVNFSEAAESLKTACFTTEILEGFDVQRTTGLGDTLRKYGFLTQAITEYYSLLNVKDKHDSPNVCPPFSEFVKRCEDLDKITISDVFAIQLLQVPQVTEEVAMAVLDLYPTILSLVRAYSVLDGDIYAQEEMLKKQSNGKVNGSASKNIFQLFWGN